MARPAVAQEHPARRLSSIVGVVVDEYGKAVDARGRLISAQEFQEAIDFLADARAVAERLSGPRADATRMALDSLIGAVRAMRPPAELAELRARFMAAVGTEGALELPPQGTLDVARGAATYARQCASCHGETGLGDGPAAAKMNPAPPAIGRDDIMREVSPATMYRIISVGVPSTPMIGWSATLSPAERWNVIAYIDSRRAAPAQVMQGEGLFVQRCASCHGASGVSDGVLAQSLSRLPPEVGSIAWQAERTDAQIAGVVRSGMPGTAMPPSRDLTDAEVASIVAYVRTLASRPAARDDVVVAAGGAAASDGSPEAASRRSLALLDRALTSARAGKTSDAGDQAFDAYLQFEPLETPSRAKNPGLVASMERHFADFKGAVREGDLTAAEDARNAIEAGLPAIVALMQRTSGFWGAFLQSFLIILREGFEAILVIGAVVAFLLKTGHRERLRSIWIGAALGLAASGVTAVVLATVLAAMPASREILEGVTMLVAVAVLFSVSYWLISKVEAARWQQFIKDKVNDALERGGGTALAFVAFLAVYREGAETALFYQALFAEGSGLGAPLSLGIVVGFAALSVVFTLFYKYGVRIPLRPFFAVTSALLYYLALVFIGKGVRELQEGNLVPITKLPGFPNWPAIGLYSSVETVLAQLVLLGLFIFALARTFWPRRAVALPTVPTPVSAPAGNGTGPLEARLIALQERVESLEKRSEREGVR